MVTLAHRTLCCRIAGYTIMYIVRLIGCPIVHSRITLRSDLGLPGHWVIVQRICWIPVFVLQNKLCVPVMYFGTCSERISYHCITCSHEPLVCNLCQFRCLGALACWIMIDNITTMRMFGISYCCVCRGCDTGILLHCSRTCWFSNCMRRRCTIHRTVILREH